MIGTCAFFTLAFVQNTQNGQYKTSKFGVDFYLFFGILFIGNHDIRGHV